MGTTHDKFREATGRWITAPSGLEYRIHGALLAEYVVWQGIVPSLIPVAEGGIPNANERDEALRKAMALIACCLDAMRWQGEMYDRVLPPEEIPAGDIVVLLQAINEISGIRGPEAEVAGRVLPE